MLRGESGIGKTALWSLALRRHREAGHRTLVTRAAEEELHGPVVGLNDLFGGVTDDDVLSADCDRFERGRRTLATLRRLASESPLVVAIDDLPWLDPVSSGALRFAFRRLDEEPVLVLATERADSITAPDDNTIPPDRREEIFVGSLDAKATRDLVVSTTGAVPRPLTERIHELSGGNPLYAIELARAADLFDDSLTATVPPTLLGALSTRIGSVGDDVLAILRVAAALGPSSPQAIARASPHPDGAGLVAAAVSHGLLVVGDDHVVRFAHPLLASAAIAGLNALERQALHARLSATVDDPDARARHLALSCCEPDAAVAADLQEASTRAAWRGASALAADLAWHSVRVTPEADVEARVRRAFTAVVHRAAAGDKPTALAEADRLVAMLPAGPVRAEAITVRVGIDLAGGDRFLAQAADEAGGDEALLGRIAELRGWLAVVFRAELDKGALLAEQALEIAVRHDDKVLEMLAAATLASARLMLGRPRPDLMRRSLDLAASTAAPRLGRSTLAIHGRHCLWCGQLGEARRILEAQMDATTSAGVEFQRPFRLLDLANVEVAAGNLPIAAELAECGLEAADDAGNDQAAAWLAYPLGLASGHLGNAERAQFAAALLRANVADQDGRTQLMMADHVLGVLALAAGDPSRAGAAMAPALALSREVGVRLPSIIPVLPDSIEAMALVGDACACAELADELGRQADAVGEPWVDAAARRGHGLAALAAGRDEAIDLLAGAAATFDELGYRVDAARSLLLQGRALRRAGRRNASADVLVDARRRFEAMGAVPWAGQAESELARVAPGREQAALTPTEVRIARLIAEGRRNREIAGELFISVATVEAHLTRMYRKLHVRSRTELARVIAA